MPAKRANYIMLGGVGLLLVGIVTSAVALINQRPTGGVRSGFLEGDIVPALATLTAGGTLQPLVWDRPTVAYVFTPNCEWCLKDYDNLVALHAGASSRYAFVGICRWGEDAPPKYRLALENYLRVRPFPGDLLLFDHRPLGDAYRPKFRVTPQTIVVERGGRVERSWAGALTEERRRDAERFFGVSLPGIKQ